MLHRSNHVDGQSDTDINTERQTDRKGRKTDRDIESEDMDMKMEVRFNESQVKQRENHNQDEMKIALYEAK